MIDKAKQILIMLAKEKRECRQRHRRFRISFGAKGMYDPIFDYSQLSPVHKLMEHQYTTESIHSHNLLMMAYDIYFDQV
jgi:hypothetical protein